MPIPAGSPLFLRASFAGLHVLGIPIWTSVDGTASSLSQRHRGERHERHEKETRERETGEMQRARERLDGTPEATPGTQQKQTRARPESATSRHAAVQLPCLGGQHLPPSERATTRQGPSASPARAVSALSTLPLTPSFLNPAREQSVPAGKCNFQRPSEKENTPGHPVRGWPCMYSVLLAPAGLGTVHGPVLVHGSVSTPLGPVG